MGWAVQRWKHVVFWAAFSTTVAVTTTAAVPAVGTPKVPGIDVSKYQGKIDWRAVASTPVRFAIMRATLGNRYRDGRYAENLSGATANGIVVGAYHFAKPSLAPWDARAEADHFLAVAQVAPGDVVPVLDIEEAGALSSGRLRAWARAWLDRVHQRTGVRAMIYSGNHFWHGSMRNTPWFGERGHLLWVAHWNVRAPDVPGHRWAGKGYTVWQWSATGKVAGIKGHVDRDWFRGSLARGTIASLTVDPATDGMISGDRIACGGSHERCFRLADPYHEITLTATPEENARLIGWTGACAPVGDARTCTVTAHGAREVSAVFGHPSEVADTGSASAAHVLRTRHREVRPSRSPVRTGDEADPPHHPWRRERDRRTIGGSYRWVHRASASISYAFRGGAITLFTVSGPAMGRARVSIDGDTLTTIDGYAPTFRPEIRHRFTGLGSGAHTLTVTALGRKRVNGRGPRVAVDALRWGGRLHRDPEPESAS